MFTFQRLLHKENTIYGELEGEFDTYTAPTLRDQLDTIEIVEGVNIVLDFENVTYIDSSGLGVIVAFYKKIVKYNGNLKLVNLSNKLKRLFEITGLSELITIETKKKVDF